MALRKKDGITKPAARQSKKEIGKIRRSQLITTYGVGALVAVGEQSFIVSGLDSWPDEGVGKLEEFRLQTRLGVPKGFRLPPAEAGPTGEGVAVRRFPQWYTCPGQLPDSQDGCTENLRPWNRFSPTRGRNECSGCGGALTPSRFVVACDGGHVDDFPYFRWVHAGTSPSGGDGKHELSYTTSGRTASLRSIVIACSCGKRASLEGVMGRRSMKSINHSCSGARPWLGKAAQEQGCDRPVRVLQRGSSAAWLPVVRSALSIPPFSTRLYSRLLECYDMLKGEDDQTVRRLAPKWPSLADYSPDEILAAVRAYEAYEAGARDDPALITGFEASDVLREQEFRQLCRTSVPDDENEFECAPPDDAEHFPLPAGLSQVMLVKRLREVRVLQSFTRVEAAAGAEDVDRLSKLSVADVGWLPGIQVSGEGVLLRLDESLIGPWADALERRIGLMRSRHQEVLDRRTPEGSPRRLSPVTARFVLTHSLAHALINEWSLDAGYPASSMRERLFVSEDMAGLLIYTATSDSAGSLGGLVDLGRMKNLGRTFANALQRQGWCSADPLCLESEASGVDSLNLAACHSCLLLPETSCEYGNSFLDRAVLVGAESQGVPAFFR